MFSKRGVGDPCGMFSQAYILTLIIILIIIGLLLYKYRNIKEEKIYIIIKISAVLVTILEIIKIVYNLYNGYNILDNYFPLSFCSIFIYSLWVAGFGNNYFKQVGICFIEGGAIIAGLAFLIFPTSSLTMHPIYHYLSLYSMFYHGLMLFIGLLIYIDGMFKYNLKNFFKYIIYCLFFMIIAVILNNIYDVNLMFLSEPFNIPLKIFDIIHDFSPFIYQVLIILVYLIIPYFLMYLVHKVKGKCN